ncbi:MAG: flagellar filament capping protein FliD [Solirubrobacteraceae bacterium]
MPNFGLAGLASGVDTAAIVEQLMGLERQGKARLQLRQSGIASQQTTLRDLKTKLDALKAAAADLRAATTWSEGQTVESSDARVAVARTGGAPIGGYSVRVAQLAASAQKTYTWTESASATTLSIDGDGPAGADPITVDIAAGAKLADVASTINGRADLPVYAAVVGGDKLVLSSRATGATVDFTATGSQLSAPANAVAGRNAEFYLNGSATKEERATNVVEDAIAGLRLSFKGTTADAASIVVGAPGIDRKTVKGEVNAFVDAYNAVVTATRAKVGEKKVKDATTLTDANKGQFFGDSGLNAMLSKLRSGMGADYTAIGNAAALDDLRDIGISTGRPGASTEQARAGLLTIDDAKLTAALDGDAQGVRRLLGGVSGTSAFAQDVEQLADDLAKTLDGRLESTDGQSRRIGDELRRTDTRLAAKEKRLKAQFAAMESALGASQTQMAWLQGQLAGLPTRS